MNEESEGTGTFEKTRRAYHATRAFLTGCSMFITMIVWTVSLSIPIEWRWCGSAHVWARHWM
ncbi:hypothetical protein KQI84_18230 [bacterium]|nr:hypothetical protein [bacterium]